LLLVDGREQGGGDGQSRKLGLLLLVEERRLRLLFGGENNCRLLLCISGGRKKSRGKEREDRGCSCWCGLVARVSSELKRKEQREGSRSCLDSSPKIFGERNLVCMKH
jgi:hypothetical protein